ncbi:MAG: hypothetical protein Q8S22_00050 [Eubacteriales bacterium]|jgi:hypothetical protein|nr:hypothetical protein [Eubacteriales bacterium]
MATQQGGTRTYAPVNSAGSPSRRKKKKKKNSTLIFSMVTLGILGIALLIYQFIFNQQEATVSMEITPISATATYINTGDGLLYQTDGQIHFYHLTDNKNNYTYGMGASDIRMSGSESMTVVFNKAQLQVVGEKTPLSFTGAVEEVECGTSHLALMRQAEDGTESVLIITRSGEQIADLSYPDQCIIDFGFYTTTSEMLWIETLNVGTGAPMTTISTYDLSKQEVTGMIHVQSQLVDDIYITPDSMFVVCTNQIIRFIHEGNKEIYRRMIYGYEVLDFSFASGTPTFLLTTRGGDFHTVRILTLAEGSAPAPVETTLQLPTEGVSAFIMGSRLAVASREQLLTYTIKGRLSTTATFEQPIDTAIKLTDTKLLLSSNGMFYIANAN